MEPLVPSTSNVNDPSKVTGPPADSINLTIQFVGARNLPRTDPVGGGSDPYFKATLGDDVISYTSVIAELGVYV